MALEGRENKTAQLSGSRITNPLPFQQSAPKEPRIWAVSRTSTRPRRQGCNKEMGGNEVLSDSRVVSGRFDVQPEWATVPSTLRPPLRPGTRKYRASATPARFVWEDRRTTQRRPTNTA